MIFGKPLPKWAKEYTAIGVGPYMFAPQQRALLEAIREKYLKSYAGHLEKLKNYFKTPAGRAKRGLVSVLHTINECAEMVKVIGLKVDALLSTTNPATEDDIKELFVTMKSLKERLRVLVDFANENERAREIFKKFQEETLIDIKSLGEAHKFMEIRLRGIVPRESWMARAAKGAPPEIRELPRAFGYGALGLLGPAAGLGEWAVKSITGMVRAYREKKARRQALKIAPVLERESAFAKIPEYALAQGQPLFKTMAGPVEPKEVRVGGAKVSIGELPPEVQARIKQEVVAKERAPAPIAGGGGLNTRLLATAMSGALFLFFNKEAFRARWTSEIYKMLIKTKGLGGVAAVKGGGGLAEAVGGGLLTRLGNIGKTIGRGITAAGRFMISPAGLGLAGAGMGIWDAFKAQRAAKEQEWFGETGKPLTIGQKISAGIGGFLGGTGKGLGEKGATLGDVAKQTGWGLAKGAAIGGAIGSIIPGLGTAIGAAVGAGIGGLTHLVGGGRIAKGLYSLWKKLPWIKKEEEKIVPYQKKVEQIVEKSGTGVEKVAEGNRRLEKKLDEVVEAVRSRGGTVAVPTRGKETDVYNIRDPLLESLNKGELTLEM